MNSRIVVISIAIVAIAIFGVAALFYGGQPNQPASRVVANFEDAGYVRPHSFVIGPVDAPVTISEFFDPSCEACRAYYPIVKQIMDRHPDQVKLVLRYAPFHDGSAHGDPDLELAWQIAGEAGLDVATARQDALRPGILGVINTDMSDVETLGVVQTPTFFVNGKAPSGTDPQNLADLVASEVAASQ